MRSTRNGQAAQSMAIYRILGGVVEDWIYAPTLRVERSLTNYSQDSCREEFVVDGRCFGEGYYGDRFPSVYFGPLKALYF